MRTCFVGSSVAHGKGWRRTERRDVRGGGEIQMEDGGRSSCSLRRYETPQRPRCFTRAEVVTSMASSKRKRSGGGGSSGGREGAPKRSAFDEWLDDDYDSTAISTFVSCGTCFNSVMITPEELGEGKELLCPVCEGHFFADPKRLERVDGDPFDMDRYLQEKNETS